MSIENESGRASITGIALRAMVEYWNNTLSGGYIQTLRQVGDEKFVLKVRTKEKNVELLIQLPEWITETNRKWPLAEEQAGIVNATKDAIDNVRITRITQHGLDRIIVIASDTAKIVIELFGGGNILVLDQNEKIVHVHHAREWKGRVLKRGNLYKFPNGPTAWDEWPVEKPTTDDKPFRTLGGWMVSTLGIPPAWIGSVTKAIEREPSDTKQITQTEWKELRAHMQKIMKKMNEGATFTIENDAILPAIGKEKDTTSMEELFSRIEADVLAEKKVAKKDTKRESEMKSLQINAARQEAQVKAWHDKVKETQEKGEWVYTHFQEVENVLKAVARAKKEKMDPKKVLTEIQKKYPLIKRIDFSKDEVEWDTE